MGWDVPAKGCVTEEEPASLVHFVMLNRPVVLALKPNSYHYYEYTHFVDEESKAQEFTLFFQHVTVEAESQFLTGAACHVATVSWGPAVHSQHSISFLLVETFIIQ